VSSNYILDFFYYERKEIGIINLYLRNKLFETYIANLTIFSQSEEDIKYLGYGSKIHDAVTLLIKLYPRET